VRVYRRVQRVGYGGHVTQVDRVYVTEQRTSRQTTGQPELKLVDPRAAATTSVQFDCDMFNDQDEAGGYCFVYVSTANIGAVTEHKSICLPTLDNQQGLRVRSGHVVLLVASRKHLNTQS